MNEFREVDCEVIVEQPPRGGQHVSVTPSAVTLKHRPTGFVVTVRAHPSQFQNKQHAMRELRELVESALERHPDDNG